MLTTNKYAHIAHGMCYWTSHYVVIPTLHFWNTGHSWRIVTINSHLRLFWFLLINLLTFHFTKNGVCSSIWIRRFPSHATSKTCQSSPFISNMMPPKCCSHLRFKMANRPVQLPCVSHRCVYKRLLSVPQGTYEYCSMTALLENSPATACTVGRSGLLEPSCIVAWCDYSTIWPYVVAWRSYVRLVGDKVHDQELVLTCLKLDVVQAASNFLPFFFWAMMSCMITSLHHRTYVHVRHMVKHLR